MSERERKIRVDAFLLLGRKLAGRMHVGERAVRDYEAAMRRIRRPLRAGVERGA
jgi:hypothetical protein